MGFVCFVLLCFVLFCFSVAGAGDIYCTTGSQYAGSAGIQLCCIVQATSQETIDDKFLSCFGFAVGSPRIVLFLRQVLLKVRQLLLGLRSLPNARHGAAADVLLLLAHTKTFAEPTNYATIVGDPVQVWFGLVGWFGEVCGVRVCFIRLGSLQQDRPPSDTVAIVRYNAKK